MLEDFCEIWEGSEDKEGPGSFWGVETEGEVESLFTVSILSDEEASASAAAAVHRMTHKHKVREVSR